MIRILVHGIAPTTEVITTPGVIHGGILITVQDGQAHSVTIGAAPGITDGAWALVMATIATHITHGQGTLTTDTDIHHIRTTAADGDTPAR